MENKLKELEQESISIIRSTIKQSSKPVILYSIGKDSSVLLHLFRKAFFPLDMSVELLHIDTGWKFSEMITFRDSLQKKHSLNLKVFESKKINSHKLTPFNSKDYTNVMKTDALKIALSDGKYDFVYGGSRRDEEPSRSKEKIFSFRDKEHRWNPTGQRIEPWQIFNHKHNPGESFRIFPMSNWTELDIWQYIKEEKIEIVNLYFSKKRKSVIRDKEIYLLDDDRFELKKTDKIIELDIRFRTLGCYPLTLGIESDATDIDMIINEIVNTKYSERYGRIIDKDTQSSMEIKKKKGYF